MNDGDVYTAGYHHFSSRVDLRTPFFFNRSTEKEQHVTTLDSESPRIYDKRIAFGVPPQGNWEFHSQQERRRAPGDSLSTTKLLYIITCDREENIYDPQLAWILAE